jgi:hypothetical protein
MHRSRKKRKKRIGRCQASDRAVIQGMHRGKQRKHPYQSLAKPSILGKLGDRCKASNQAVIRGMDRGKQRGHPYQSMVKPSILGRCQASGPMVIPGMYRRRWMHHCQSMVSGCSSRHRCFGRASTARIVSARASFSSTQDARGPYSIRSLLWLTSCPGYAGNACAGRKCQWHPHRGCRVQILDSTDDAHRPAPGRGQLGDRQARTWHKWVLTSRVAD